MAAAIAATFTITITIVIDQEFKEESTANFVAVLTITERAITITIIIVIDQEAKEESTANFVAVLTITERAIGGFGSIVVVIIINTWEEKMLNSAGDGVIFGTQLLHHSG